MKCQPDGLVYTSNPPQSKCRVCGKFWYSHEPVPNCDVTMTATNPPTLGIFVTDTAKPRDKFGNP